MRGKDTQDEAGEVGKDHDTQGLAGYKEGMDFMLDGMGSHWKVPRR